MRFVEQIQKGGGGRAAPVAARLLVVRGACYNSGSTLWAKTFVIDHY